MNRTNKNSKDRTMTYRISFNRRRFLGVSGAALSAPFILPSGLRAAQGKTAANDKLTLALIGCGGMGGYHLDRMIEKREAGEINIAALCDVDENRLAQRLEKTGAGVQPYRDYRYVLEREDIDAVMIATPDHWHANQMVHAAETGKHVYVEKPACCTIEEGTAMMKAAKDNKIAVQVGSQGRSQPEAYLSHRYLANGVIGHVDRVDCFHYPSPIDEEPVPDSEPPAELDWDLWLGPMHWRPYNKKYCHGTFRWLMESGGGQIRDRGAHVMSCAKYWMNADDQGPTWVEATGTSPEYGLWDSCVNLNVTYTFENPDWVLTWNQPGEPVPKEERTPEEAEITRPGYGAVYRGDKGTFHHWGGDGGTWAERKAREWEPPSGAVDVYKSPGHMEDWIEGIKTGKKTIMNIDAAVGVADLCNLGNLSYLLGRKLHWDHKNRKIIGDDYANRLLARPQRHPYHL
jgi:predicted dehydrogenase